MSALAVVPFRKKLREESSGVYASVSESVGKYRCQSGGGRAEGGGGLLRGIGDTGGGAGEELAAKRAMPEARVPETSAGSGVFPLNALNCENSFVSRRGQTV